MSLLSILPGHLVASVLRPLAFDDLKSLKKSHLFESDSSPIENAFNGIKYFVMYNIDSRKIPIRKCKRALLRCPNLKTFRFYDKDLENVTFEVLMTIGCQFMVKLAVKCPKIERFDRELWHENVDETGLLSCYFDALKTQSKLNEAIVFEGSVEFFQNINTNLTSLVYMDISADEIDHFVKLGHQLKRIRFKRIDSWDVELVLKLLMVCDSLEQVSVRFLTVSDDNGFENFANVGRQLKKCPKLKSIDLGLVTRTPKFVIDSFDLTKVKIAERLCYFEFHYDESYQRTLDKMISEFRLCSNLQSLKLNVFNDDMDDFQTYIIPMIVNQLIWPKLKSLSVKGHCEILRLSSTKKMMDFFKSRGLVFRNIRIVLIIEDYSCFQHNTLFLFTHNFFIVC